MLLHHPDQAAHGRVVAGASGNDAFPSERLAALGVESDPLFHPAQVAADHVIGGASPRPLDRDVVGVDEATVSISNHHRFGDSRHHGVHAALDALEVGEEAGMIERQGEPACECAGERQVVAIVRSMRPGDTQRQRAEEPPPGDHGDDCARAHSQ